MALLRTYVLTATVTVLKHVMLVRLCGVLLFYRYVEDGISRALGNLGRSHGKAGNFNRAVKL